MQPLIITFGSIYCVLTKVTWTTTRAPISTAYAHGVIHLICGSKYHQATRHRECSEVHRSCEVQARYSQIYIATACVEKLLYYWLIRK